MRRTDEDTYYRYGIWIADVTAAQTFFDLQAAAAKVRYHEQRDILTKIFKVSIRAKEVKLND